MKKLFLPLCAFFCASSLFAQTLKLDFTYDLSGKNVQKNKLTWAVDGTKTKDRYDTKSGASLNRTTLSLKNAVTDMGGKSFLIPKALYELMLFAVSNPAYAEDIKIQRNERTGGHDILMIHRGNAYKIQADADGRIDVLKDCFIFNNFAKNSDGKFIIAEEFASEDKNSQWPDFSKITFEADKGTQKENKCYQGTLRIQLKGDVLKLSGKLLMKELKAEKEKPEDKPEAAEKTDPVPGM